MRATDLEALLRNFAHASRVGMDMSGFSRRTITDPQLMRFQF
jgi:hypothetical protein